MKKSSYQKLKEENKKLRNDIHTLVNEPKSVKAIELQVIYSRPVMTPIMFSVRNNHSVIGCGIIDQTNGDCQDINEKNKPDINTIKSISGKLMSMSIFKKPEIKCGKLFHEALHDISKDVLLMGIPFKDAIVNPQLFGIEVILDETLPANVARIGNDFFKLNNTQNK